MSYIPVLALFLLALTACSSGGGAPALSRDDQAELLEQELLATNVTDPGLLPQSGAASYRGFMTARLPTGAGGARVDYLGDLAMTVDFEATRNQVSGRATGFVAGQDALSGRLVIAGGDLFRDTVVDENYTFTGDVDGRLTRGAAAYLIDAEINGEFRGRNQDGVSGLLFGDVTGPDGQDIFDGDFFAARD